MKPCVRERFPTQNVFLYFFIVFQVRVQPFGSAGHLRTLQSYQTTQTKAKTNKEPTEDNRLPSLQGDLPSYGKDL